MADQATPFFTEFAGSPEGTANFLDILRSLPTINGMSTDGPFIKIDDKHNTLNLFIVDAQDASLDLDHTSRRPLDGKVRGYVSAQLLNGGEKVHLDRRPYITRLDQDCQKSDRAYALWGATESATRVHLYIELSDEAARDHQGLQFVWTFLKKFAPDHPYVAARLEELGEAVDLSIVEAVHLTPCA